MGLVSWEGKHQSQSVACSQVAKPMSLVDPRLHFYKRPCDEMNHIIAKMEVPFAGVLLDLSPQMTAAEECDRGLSYYEAVPLDGRLNKSVGVPAVVWLQQVSVSDLANVLQEWLGPWHSEHCKRFLEGFQHHQSSHGVVGIRPANMHNLWSIFPTNKSLRTTKNRHIRTCSTQNWF